ncbi:M15 family metallopeptidase [Pseudalkalibacillus hwajinpoensis]|uniref:D-alanyl-D-alanine carboxypeptidase family protein n=1 Tax=Guptibacillus hwajinpoensis TaxID=208199 RepID=A0A4U1MLL3_9BACL|nr:M15 family metallopeptidase [Pseudalkalibacillus hwajinpoensis]TKD71591.1 D-alanyl-D-alanine carboxypeptidase family protein [Pseudalkalibacillus hwajinpoensis]
MTMKNLFIASGLSLALLAGCQANDSNQEADQTTNQNQSNDQTNTTSKETNNISNSTNSEDQDNNAKNNEDQEYNSKQSDAKESEENNKADQSNQAAYPTMAETVTENNGQLTVTNPDSIYVVANKERNLPADFVPENLVEPDVASYAPQGDPKRLMVKEAANALEEMFAAAKEEGYELKAVSGYRSYDRQEAIFAYNADRYGKEKANQVSAQAGQSEHQTGLTMDISTPSIGSSLTEEFGNTPEGKWVAKNAYKYGFVVRYLKGKEEITGYQYEPWHVRYVGKEAAKDIQEAGYTLEEFFPNKK